MSQRKQTNQLQPFDASQCRVGIVVADFNADITGELLASALKKAKEFKISTKNITVCRVAGSVEIPVILKTLAASGKYDALVALGVIIRGETDHYEYVAKVVTEGVLAVMMEYGIPVGFGVLTCENVEQTQTRLGSGGGALAAALHCAKVIRELKKD